MHVTKETFMHMPTMKGNPHSLIDSPPPPAPEDCLNLNGSYILRIKKTSFYIRIAKAVTRRIRRIDAYMYMY